MEAGADAGWLWTYLAAYLLVAIGLLATTIFRPTISASLPSEARLIIGAYILMKFLAVSRLTILLGTPILSLIGSIGVALTIGLRKGGIILSLLVLPLYVPVLIFAASAIDVAAGGLPASAQISMLLAFLFVPSIRERF